MFSLRATNTQLDQLDDIPPPPKKKPGGPKKKTLTGAIFVKGKAEQGHKGKVHKDCRAVGTSKA